MASTFLRGKQSGMANDLSAGILPGLFAPDDQARYGINSQVSCLAYDPVQSLLAVGTSESRFGAGRIYVFGQQRVCKFLGLEPELGASPASYRALAFVGGGSRLVSLDAKSRIVLWDLDSARRVAGTTVAGHVVAMETDPMLDWAFLGTREGDVLAFDLDRERMGQFRLGNLWKMRDQVEQGQPGGAAGRSGGVGGSYLGRSRTTTTAPAQLVGLALHPRDIGKLLVAYTTGAVIYSFKQEAPVKYFEYVLQPGAPGGNAMATDSVRRPRLVQALWHPAGTFILTAHEDGSLVFWDPKDGRVVMARTLYDVKIDQPVPNPSRGGGVAMDPFVRIAWCCKDPNTEDTGLLVAGGQMADVPDKGLTFIELGVTPTYATSSWQVLTEFFRGKRQSSLPVPLGAVVVDFCLIPRASPHFAGAQDPVAVICVLSSGELVTLSFPSGYRISPTNQLHPSLTFVHPFVTRMAVSTLDRGRWLGMVENRSGTGEPLLRGGAEARKPKKRFEGRTIVQAAHADGTIRMWDTGHQDDIENESALQVDLARALDRVDDSDGASVEVTALNMADGTGEFAAGTRNGELVVWRWAGNKYYGNEDAARNMGHASNPGGLTDISARAEPNLKEGLQPYVLYEMLQGPISCVRVSDVGFVGVGSEGGFFSLIDLRGPAVVLHVSMQELAKGEKRSVFLGPGSSSRGSSSGAPGSREYPVVVEFGVMTLEGDGYSSICCFVGTSAGRVATFKILPSGSGYTAKLAGQVTFGDRVIAINPIIADSGKPAAATGPVVAGLRNGQQIHGILVVVTQTEIRIFKPATAKGASKSFDDTLCDAAAVTEFELHGFALVGVFGDRTARAYSLPGLKEIGRARLPMLDPSRQTSAVVTQTGDIFGWTGPSEMAVVSVWGVGRQLENSQDRIVNPDLTVPARPTISNLEWISGTQYVSPTDLDLLVGGPSRPPSKRMLAAAEAERRAARAGGAAGPSNPRAGTSQEGWGEYLTRQLNERTEKLNIMGDSMDNLQNQSQAWADDVSKYISKQKRNIVLGGITKKFF